jgi:phosphoenolpyruvate carboxykinase (GTP)
MNHVTETDRVTAPAIRAHRSPDDLANAHVRRFVHRALRLCLPDEIYWLNGGAFERGKLVEQAMADGVLTAADAAGLPGWYVRGGGADASGDGTCGERSTFVCTPTRETAGPADNWMGSPAAREKVRELFDRCMVGRTMYVVPFGAGPTASGAAGVGVLITDSLFEALRTAAMARAGDAALRELGDRAEFCRCLHSAGDRRAGAAGPCRFGFPAEREVYVYGSDHAFGREALFLAPPPVG